MKKYSNFYARGIPDLYYKGGNMAKHKQISLEDVQLLLAKTDYPNIEVEKGTVRLGVRDGTIYLALHNPIWATFFEQEPTNG